MMGAKGLWRHIKGTTSAPVLFITSNGITLLTNRKTLATEHQIVAKESKLIEFKKREYLAQHILLSTTSTHLRTKIKSLLTSKDMWKAIKNDATLKSTLYILDAGD
jgi:hypothetical protein